MSSGAFTLADVDKPNKGKFSAGDVDNPSQFGAGTQVNNTVERLTAKVLQGAGLPTSIANIPDWFEHLTGAAKDSEPWWQPLKNAVKNPTQENITNAVPIIGPMSVSMARDAKAGNYADAAATMVGALSLIQGAKQISPGLSAGKKELIDATRTAENQLTPGVKAVASLFKLVGGPEVADAALPNRPPAADFKGGAYSDYFGESGKAVPIRQSPAFNAAEYNAGASERNALKGNPSPETFPNASSSATSVGTAELPKASSGIPQGNTSLFASGKGFSGPEPSIIQSPLSPPPPINRTLVSYDRNLLVHMARGGDLNALRELIRNPGSIDVASAVPNSKYLLEGGAPTNIYGGPGSK